MLLKGAGSHSILVVVMACPSNTVPEREGGGETKKKGKKESQFGRRKILVNGVRMKEKSFAMFSSLTLSILFKKI